MQDQDKILQFLRSIGPTIPSKVAKNINTDILFASAHLSDLSAQGKVKISNLKIGGTPLYYLPGQESQLFNFAQNNLNPKDFIVLERLKQEKIFRESTLDLLTKVALRALKDFAIPLIVNMQDKSELFWKWHLLGDEETNQRIGAMLNPNEKNEEIILTPPPQELPLTQMSETKPTLESSKPMVQEKLPSLLSEPEKPFIDKTEKIKEKPKKKRVPINDDLLEDSEAYFKKMKIQIDQKETLRKNAELNFILKVPSVVGLMTYFCKVKNKAKCDEKDLAAAYMEAQMKKLPLLFLYTQDLNKKATDMLEAGAFENVIVRRIE